MCFFSITVWTFLFHSVRRLGSILILYKRNDKNLWIICIAFTAVAIAWWPCVLTGLCSPSLLAGLGNLYELDASNNELVTLSDHTFIDQKRSGRQIETWSKGPADATKLQVCVCVCVTDRSNGLSNDSGRNGWTDKVREEVGCRDAFLVKMFKF